MGKNTNNKKSKNKSKNTYASGYRLPDYVNYIFLLAIFLIYPIITDNKYFNITKTRYTCYIYIAGIYIFLMLIAMIIDITLESYLGSKAYVLPTDDKKLYQKPDFWMVSFLMANVFAYLCAYDQSNAMFGSDGRHMGLFIYIIIALMFILIAQRLKINIAIFIAFAISTGYAYVIAIFQHMGNDFMNYKDRIAINQKDIFISTLGNINIFASFLCISIPVFLCIYIFSKKIVYKIIAGVMLLGGGMVIMIANSDSAYLGFAAIAVLIFLLAYNDGCVKKYIQAMFFIAVGNLGVVLLNKLVIIKYDKRGGVAQALDRIDLAVMILVMLAVVYILVVLASKRFDNKLKMLNKKKVMLAIIVMIVIMAAVVIAVGAIRGMSLFTFNYKWGTYRGYIWTKCVELFKDAPLVNKIFGYGNESIRTLMVSNYYEEMKSVTGKIYDNAHNELLQYLVTTGIMGMVTYIGLFVSSFIYILKNSNKMPIAYICLSAITGYFVQGLINLNQPITTPFYFVFMAMGVGYVRYCKRVEENSD